MICDDPFYNISFYPNTFSAEVYYYHLENDQLIKYQANIGPMTNIHAEYSPVLGTPNHDSIPVIQRLKREKNTIGKREDYYLIPKRIFFNTL